MNENSKVITSFYNAFQAGDAELMVSHYSDDVSFSDPAFGNLNGEHARNMWRMLITSQKGKQFDIVYKDVEADEKGGTGHWQATYNFSQTGRKVVNEIDALFEIKNGKITKHVDTFDIHKWARQAMGFKGLLLGGTGFFKKKLQAQTNGMLANWERKRNS